MNNNLNLFCNDFFFSKISEEQILFLGKVETNIIQNNKTFRDLDQQSFKKVINYCNIENCDFIYHPFKYNPEQDLSLIERISKEFKKKILIFYNDDDDKIFEVNDSIIFRTSLYKSKKPRNNFSVPAFCNDLKKETDYFYRSKTETPTIGFCGAITNNYRQIIIDIINNSRIISKNFIIRKNFWGGDIWGQSVRQDYINNTLNSDFVICVRGSGNFSYRFYETICLGRIPLILDTDISLPFEDFLNYDFILKIRIDELSNLESIIMNYWNNINDYNILQKEIIHFWNNHLSPIGFIKTLNKYKHEINSLLH